MPLVRCLITLVVIALLGVLTPAAYADPPDPTWLGGYWDDDDFDTAVAFITNASAISVSPVIEANHPLVPAERIEPRDPILRSLTLRALACPRAPPARPSSDN